MIKGPGSRVSTPTFSVNYYESVLKGGRYLDRFDNIFNYNHVIQAFGGFDQCSFDIAVNQNGMERWFEDGLGRHVVVYDEYGEISWEGFIDKVTVVDAGLEVSRGPLLESGNRVSLTYSGFDFDNATSPDAPLPGIRKTTPFVDDTVAQDKYGIIYKMLSVSGVSNANALILRDMYIAENAEPVTSNSFSFMPENPSVTLECKGYSHWLNNFPYNNLVQGFSDLSDKIISILGSDPNGYISTDYSNIIENTLQVPSWENDFQKADGILKGTVAMGDSNNHRYTLGIYENRIAHYQAVPDHIDYHIHLHDQTRTIYSHPTDRIIQPWSVRPGRWIKFIDFLPGLSFNESNLRYDPRNLFIEAVEFSMPNTFSFTGGRTDKLHQKVARLGLSGIGG